MSKQGFELSEHLCFTIYATSIAINRLYKPLLDEMEITYPQYLVLTTLYEKGPLTISEIAESLFLNSSTITPLVKRLQGADLISRTRNAKNERQVIVELTEKGTHLQREAQCLGTTLAARSGMSTDQLMTLNAQLSQLKETISKLEPPTGE